MKHVLLGLMTAAAATANAGEAVPYAKVAAVNGKVTISSKSQMVPAAVGMALAQGSTVLPGSDASVSVRFASGCQVGVRAGQALTVDEGFCSAANAKANTVRGSAGSAATGGEGTIFSFGSTTYIVVAVVAGGLVIRELTKDDDTPAAAAPAPAPAPAPVAAAPSPAPARAPARAPAVSGS